MAVGSGPRSPAMNRESPLGPPKRTAEIGERDDWRDSTGGPQIRRSPVRHRGRGSRQNPAKPREFLGLSRAAGAKSLQPQTGWRWAQSRANPSLGAESLLSRENTGNSAEFGPSRRAEKRSTARFRPPSVGFPWAREQGKRARRSGNPRPGTGKAHEACSRWETVGVSASPTRFRPPA